MSDLQLTLLFYFVDNFCKRFLPFWQRFLINNANKNRIRTDCLSISEIMVILGNIAYLGEICHRIPITNKI